MRRWMLLLLTGGLLCTGACVEEADHSDAIEQTSNALTKDQARSMEGKGTNGADLCEVHGWYDDGVCDDFCVSTDDDCGEVEPLCETNDDCPEGRVCAGGACVTVPPANCDDGTEVICDLALECPAGQIVGVVDGCLACFDPDTCEQVSTNEVACGGWLGDTCQTDEYCDFGESTMCDYADASGICRPRPTSCDDVYEPVCGCDGEIYDNDCSARSAGVDVYHEGACEQQACVDDASCGPGQICEGGVCLAGVNCDDDTEMLCDLELECPAGQVVALREGCLVCLDARTCEEPAKSCGGSLGDTCADDEYCDFGESTMCDFADGVGICQPRPEGCIQVYEPVCGCDGQTYGNECEAAAAGVDVQADGACAG